MPLTDTGAAKTLDGILGSSHASTWPATVHVALSTTDPATATTEPTGGYARSAVLNDSTRWPNVSTPARTKTCAVAVPFPTATADWGVVAYYAIYDAATAGNQLAYGALTAAQTVLNGDVVTIPISGLVVTVT